MITLFFCLLLADGKSQEVATPASLLGPRHFNHHAFDAEQYLRSLNLPVPTKQGPVLFPNDGPPTPRPPLVVTSRPLVESIANSNINPLPRNNTLTTYTNSLPAIRYIGGYKNYKPFEEDNTDFNKDIYDYDAKAPLPLIYNDISNRDEQKATQHRDPKRYEVQVHDPDYTHQQSNEIHDDADSEYNHNQNYAFSYSVKDKKTGDDFSHSQNSKGSATNGEYRVRLPDGRMQIVSYTADENGYKADVRYDEEKPLSNSIQHNNYIDYINNNNANYDYVDNYIANGKVNTDNNNVVQRDFKYNKESPSDYYNNNYDSRQYYNEDYSAEYNNKYQPYESKFTKFLDNDKIEVYRQNSLGNVYDTSTIKPSYSALKDLFVTKTSYDTRQNYNNPAVLNGPSTPKYTGYVPTTETVVIGTKPSFYANLNNHIALFSTPITATTPRSYLVSTISSLKNRIVQPVLSGRFIDKINKYLTFN